MKKILNITCILIGLFLPQLGLAYIENTDNILDDSGNAIYMIGSVFNRLTSGETEAKEDSFRIYKINLKDNGKVIYYRGDNKSMDRLTLSPDYNFIAVMRREKYRYVEILLINKKLKRSAISVQEPDGIISYAWSPDSKKIAYIAGIVGEKERINAKGVWIYDIEREEKRKIADAAENIEWLPTGELCLYIKYDEQKDGRRQTIRKTQLFSQRGDKIRTESKGVNLSQDGRYSVDPRYIGMGEFMENDKAYIDFYDLKDERKIMATSLDNIFNERPRIMWGPILWLKNNRIVIEKFILIDPKDRYSGVASNVRDISICDIKKNKVLKELKGEIVGVNGDRSKLVIYSDGKFTAVDVP